VKCYLAILGEMSFRQNAQKKPVSNAKISAQKSNFEKTDHLLGKVTEFYFQTLIKQ
jgi:hypothetical protein